MTFHCNLRFARYPLFLTCAASLRNSERSCAFDQTRFSCGHLLPRVPCIFTACPWVQTSSNLLLSVFFSRLFGSLPFPIAPRCPEHYVVLLYIKGRRKKWSCHPARPTGFRISALWRICQIWRSAGLCHSPTRALSSFGSLTRLHWYVENLCCARLIAVAVSCMFYESFLPTHACACWSAIVSARQHIGLHDSQVTEKLKNDPLESARIEECFKVCCSSRP